METFKIKVNQTPDREYNHGELNVVQQTDDRIESNVEGDIHLTVSSEQFTDFCEEIQKVIAKYAI